VPTGHPLFVLEVDRRAYEEIQERGLHFGVRDLDRRAVGLRGGRKENPRRQDDESKRRDPIGKARGTIKRQERHRLKILRGEFTRTIARPEQDG
jgi:hypothetical protein